MSQSRRRARARKHGREKCPKCGSKNVRLLNKSEEMLILECKRVSCNTKWHIPNNTNTKIRLSDNDIKYELAKKDMDQETKQVIQEVEAPPVVGLEDVVKT